MVLIQRNYAAIVMTCEVKDQHQPGIKSNFVQGFPSNQVFVLSGRYTQCADGESNEMVSEKKTTVTA